MARESSSEEKNKHNSVPVSLLRNLSEVSHSTPARCEGWDGVAWPGLTHLVAFQVQVGLLLRTMQSQY